MQLRNNSRSAPQAIVLAQRILVKDMPEGYFKEQLTKIVTDPATVSVWVVASTGASKTDWAAYVGFPDRLAHIKLERRSDEGLIHYTRYVSGIQDILSNGDKLSEQEARAIFETSMTYRS